MTPTADQLQPGDVLLYDTPDDLVDWIITRTGPAAHVEFYEGNRQSLASRNGIGVGRYDLRLAGLIGVVRLDVDYATLQAFVAEFSKWFETVKGDGYDWQGLLGFIEVKDMEAAKHLFCSAFLAAGFAAAALRIAGVEVFNKLWPHGLITPTDFFKTVRLKWVGGLVDISKLAL